MNRQDRIRQVVEECRQALALDSNFDIDNFLAGHSDLLPELREALEEVQRSRRSFQQEGTLVPDDSSSGSSFGSLATTIPFAESDAARKQPPAHLKYLGEYRLDELLGAGTFGEVWKATQITLSRTVAVKTLKREHLGEDLLHRFHREARALARLSHPNIVSVLEIGEHQGTHFIAMEFVDGVDLKRTLEQGLPTCQWSAQAMRSVAGAMSHAHEANLIHRDLKPANILISKRMELKVTDFGLARQTTEATELTSEGDILGTISYMAPEQAAGRGTDVGPAADIYALGATLYHLLTGRPPFPLRPQTPSLATLEEVRSADPIPPRAARPDRNIPRDLETICLKCLEKEPRQRYATAAELASDLERFLEGDPILARPTPWHERIWRKVKKRPLVASLATAVVVVALAGVLVASSLASRGKQLAEQVGQTKEQVVKVSTERDTARQTATQAQQAKTEAEKQRELAREAEAWKQYTADVQLMQVAWDGGKISLVRDLLAKHLPRPGVKDLRGIEWYFWHDRLNNSSRLVAGARGRSLALSPDGMYLATADETHATLWDLSTGKQLHRWAIGRGRVSRVMDVSDSHQDFDRSIAFSPDGKLLAATTSFMTPQKRLGSLRVWEIPAGTERMAVLDDPHLSGRSVVFSPDSRYVVAGSYDNAWQSWNVATKQEDSPLPAKNNFGPPWPAPKEGTPFSGRSLVWDLQFDKDILMARTDFTPPLFVRWGPENRQPPFDEITPKMHRQLGGPTLSAYGRDNSGELYAVGASDDNALFLYAFGNPRTKGVEITRLEGGRASHVVTQRGWFAAAGRDKVVRVWNVNLKFAPKEFRGMEEITGLALGQDGKLVAAMGREGVRLWPLGRQAEFRLPLPNATAPAAFQNHLYSRRGTYRAGSVGGVLTLQKVDGETTITTLTLAGPTAARRSAQKVGGETVTTMLPGQQTTGMWFSPDERYFAASLKGGKQWQTLLWDLQQQRQIAELPGFQMSLHAGAFSADGRLLAGRSEVWDVATGNVVFKAEQAPALGVAFSPSGKLVGFASPQESGVWNLEMKERIFTTKQSGTTIAIDPLERSVVIAGRGLSAWDLATGEELPASFGAANAVSVAFSSDGERLYALQGNTVSVYSSRGWNLLASIPCNPPRFASELEPLFEQLMGRSSDSAKPDPPAPMTTGLSN